VIAPLVAAALLAGTPAAEAPASAAAHAFQLFPVRGVQFPVDAAASESMIRPEFRTLLLEDVAYFETAFRSAFPDAARTIDDANKRRTFAVSLQIARAARYEVKKPAGRVDVYLPLTASLYFTNVMTGEVVYASTRTEIPALPLAAGEASAESESVRTAFRQNTHQLVDALVLEARKRFSAVVIGATVRSTWKSLAILDAGASQGLRAGDELLSANGGVLRVLSTGPEYAVAQPDLGRFEKGQRFEKVATDLGAIKRPRVLPLIDAAPAGMPADALVQLFSDALGEKAPVSLVPVNRTFGQVLSALGSQIATSQEHLRNRELPAFFVRLRVLDPIVFEGPTNQPHTSARVATAYALAQLLDRRGRVLFAAQGKSRVREEITAGIAFSAEAQREVAVKNALVDLARQFGERLAIASDALPLEAAGDALTVRDSSGMLAPGSVCRAFHTIGRVEGITGDVRVPLWDLDVTETAAHGARASASFPVFGAAPKPETGDVVLLEGVRSGSLASRNRIGPCGGAANIGAVEIPGYADIAWNTFAASYRGAVYSPGFTERVGELVRSGAGFATDARVAEPNLDVCVEPAYAVDAPEPSCSGGACADRARLRFGYRFRERASTGEVRLKRGIESRLTATEVRENASADTRRTSLAADLVDQSFVLNASLVDALAREAL
jgi:hypothetical protein